MNPKGLWRDPRSGIFYLRRRIPLPLQSGFACGQLYKVSLGTADPRDAERKLAIANGEFEQKCDQFRATLANGVAGSFTSDEARVLVDRLLTARSATGFASGGMDVAFFLKDLDDAVADQAGDHRSTAQDMSPAEWIAYRKKLAGSDLDDEFSPETLARIEAHHASVHRDPGELWYSFQKRVPRRRWRPLLSFAVAKMKRELKLPEEANRGIDEPLADALADALGSAQVREQVPVIPSARRRANSSRLQPDMKLDALEAKWIAARKPTPKAQAATKTAVRYFKSYIGDVGIGEITPNDLFEFRDAVAVLPKSMPRVHRMMEFVDIHALYADRSGVDRISPQSIKISRCDPSSPRVRFPGALHRCEHRRRYQSRRIHKKEPAAPIYQGRTRSAVCGQAVHGYCESFNGSLRDELLNGEIFYSLAEARILIEAWRRHYNTVRPHSSLGYRPPAPEAVPSPVSPSGSASLHLRPTLAMEASMH